mmetsp:Transcript_26283/g.37529  ORF Transcript_26283/g.37529 Transcript_26283/m.37529 type:complete len:132 (-) Transcript_26283:127-522(-)
MNLGVLFEHFLETLKGNATHRNVSNCELERIHGLDKSETSVITDLIEFESAEDRTSVVVVDWIEFDSAEDLLSVAAEWFEEDRREDLLLYFVDALASVNDGFAFKVCLTLVHRPPAACTVPDAVLSSLMIL